MIGEHGIGLINHIMEKFLGGPARGPDPEANFDIVISETVMENSRAFSGCINDRASANRARAIS
jgi:hypothetical protein